MLLPPQQEENMGLGLKGRERVLFIPRLIRWENVLPVPPAPGSGGRVQRLLLGVSSGDRGKVPLGGGRG